MADKITFTDPDFEERVGALIDARRDVDVDVDDVVRDVLQTVCEKGDDAVLGYTEKFDRLALGAPETMRFSEEEIKEARSSCGDETVAALKHAATRIAAYHEKQIPQDFDFTDDEGVRLGSRWTSISSVGLYVPGGTAAYPSSVLMNAIPANVAGVERLVMVVPTPGGALNPLVLAAASIAGVTEIYRIGGAQAIAALAYGTETIAPVDKIVGPGNAYVAAAKRQVFGVVGIDMIAGPSEILVVADAENDPSWIAADLLSQAEHDTDAQSILICDDEAFGDAVTAEIEAQLEVLPRVDIARQSWNDHGAVVVVDKLDDAIALIDRLAPEHLELAVSEPENLGKKIRNAGAIFLGRYTPEAIGDYIAGPSHVLPTSRSTRFSSGLGVQDFLKRTSLIECDADAVSKISGSAEILAREEGLVAHARSLSLRHNKS